VALISADSIASGKDRLAALGSLTRREALLAGLVSTTGIAGCASPAPMISLNVELAFEFATERGVTITGGGIWRVKTRVVSAFPNPGTTIKERLQGEALPIAVGGGEYVFALMVWGGVGVVSPPASGLFRWDCSGALFQAYGPTFPWDGRDSPDFRRLQASTPTPFASVPLSHLPAFASFSNPDDARTGRLVSPDNFMTAAGQAVIKSFRIRVVSDELTHGIENYLPWLSDEKVLAEANFTSDELAHHPDFFLRQ
jgi:hypothetical protein